MLPIHWESQGGWEAPLVLLVVLGLEMDLVEPEGLELG